MDRRHLLKILLLKKEEISIPPEGFSNGKLAPIIQIIAPLNPALIGSLVVAIFGSIYFAFYLFVLVQNRTIPGIINNSFVILFLASFVVTEIISLLIFVFEQNRSSGRVVRESNFYTFAIN